MNEQSKTPPKSPTSEEGPGRGNEPGVQKPETTPVEEWGERLDTGKAIARGGKNEGAVPGAEPSK